MDNKKVALDKGQCQQALQSLWKQGQRYGIRILPPNGPALSGVYDYASIEKACADIARVAESQPAGTGYYFTPNPVDPERVKATNDLARGATVKDADILKRDYFLVDVDPERPTGQCATDAEKEQAKATAERVREYLTARGFGAPTVIDSGNGVHLYYRTELPKDSATPKELLTDLAGKFNSDAVKIDTTVCNASRIMRLPFAMNSKGTDTPARPHRRCKLLSVGADVTPADTMAKAVAPKLDPAKCTVMTTAPASQRATGVPALNDFDMQRFASMLPECSSQPTRNENGALVWRFKRCPFGAHATGGTHAGEAVLMLDASGKRVFKCSHETHSNKGWNDLTRMFQSQYDACSQRPPAPAVELTLPKSSQQPADPQQQQRANANDAVKTALQDRNNTSPLWIVTSETDAETLRGDGYVAVAIVDQQGAYDFAFMFSSYRAGDGTIAGKYDLKKIVLAFENSEQWQTVQQEILTDIAPVVDFAIAFPVAGFYGHRTLTETANDLSPMSGDMLDDSGNTVSNSFWNAVDAVESKSPFASVGDSMAGYLEQFGANVPQVPTGFPQLDFLLEGGLESGLYVLGGVSSTGKTTFAMQIMDNIARRGLPVLIFSAEMRAMDLVARSISRETRAVTPFPLTQSQVQSVKKRTSAESQTAYNRGVERYRQYAGNITIIENNGHGNMSANEIARSIERYIKHADKRPVVFVDYLQILTPNNPRADMRQATDESVTVLKAVLNKYNIPMLVISALNRDNYTAEINLASFKESGAIEYSADVLLGLQFSQEELIKHRTMPNVDDRNDAIRAIAKAKMPAIRNVEVVLLKQRKGKSSGLVKYQYDAPHNGFVESATPYKFLLDNYGGGDPKFMDPDTRTIFNSIRDDWDRQHPNNRATGLSSAEQATMDAKAQQQAEKQSASERKAQQQIEQAKAVESNILNTLEHGGKSLTDLVATVHGYCITVPKGVIRSVALRMVQDGTLNSDGKRIYKQ